MITKPARVWALFLFLTLVVVACGSSSDPEPTPSPTIAVDSAAEEPGQETAAVGGVDGIVLHNAVIVTMDDSKPKAEAVLIRDDRIVAVGSDEDVLVVAASDAVVIDLEGRTIVPGFVDSHSHRLANYEERGYDSAAEVIPLALSEGWTTLVELNVRENNLPELEGLAESGDLRLRVEAFLATNTPDVQPLDRWWAPYQPGQVISPYLRISGLKFFVDFDWGREIRISQAELTDAVAEVQASGWQVAAKSISSDSLEVILNSFEQAQGGEGAPTYRNRVEHALAITEEQGQRMAELGVVASIQTLMPPELTDDPEFFAFAERQPAGATTPWRRVLDQGVVLANGSAWPSTYFEEPEGAAFGSPMRLLYQAATRISNRGALPEPFEPEQAITIEEALRALTIDAAYAVFRDGELGSITEGKLADLVVLSANPLEVPLEDIPFIESLVTMVGGQTEFCAAGASSICPPRPDGSFDSASPSQGLLVPSGQPLRIALIAPASGQHAELGTAQLLALQVAAGDYGPIDGFAVQVVSFDDGCGEQGGAAAAEQVVADGGFILVIGPGCSDSAQSGLPILEAAGIPLVVASATEPLLDRLAPAMFNRVVLDEDQAAAAAIDASSVEDLDAVQELYSRYEFEYGSLPTAAYRPFLAYTYDALTLALAALDSVAILGEDGSLIVDRAALATAIRRTVEHEGVTGAITIDEYGNRLP